MSTEVDRRLAGVSGRGEVVVITVRDNLAPTGGETVPTKLRYIVRQGAITVGEYASPATANTVAKALVG